MEKKLDELKRKAARLNRELARTRKQIEQLDPEVNQWTSRLERSDIEVAATGNHAHVTLFAMA